MNLIAEIREVGPLGAIKLTGKEYGLLKKYANRHPREKNPVPPSTEIEQLLHMRLLDYMTRPIENRSDNIIIVGYELTSIGQESIEAYEKDA